MHQFQTMQLKDMIRNKCQRTHSNKSKGNKHMLSIKIKLKYGRQNILYSCHNAYTMQYNIYIYIYKYCVLSDHLSTGRKLLIYNWVYFKIKTNIWKHDIISNSRLQFPLLWICSFKNSFFFFSFFTILVRQILMHLSKVPFGPKAIGVCIQILQTFDLLGNMDRAKAKSTSILLHIKVTNCYWRTSHSHDPITNINFIVHKSQQSHRPYQ